MKAHGLPHMCVLWAAPVRSVSARRVQQTSSTKRGSPCASEATSSLEDVLHVTAPDQVLHIAAPEEALVALSVVGEEADRC